ncbi:MAG: hypothetical protein SGI84_08680 [Gemmatimonadota bacterium]|nr:hypothetical protein [Gemmatimonadota bacterium]
MRLAPALIAIALVAGCTPAEEPAVEVVAVVPAAPTMADFVGTWQNRAVLTGVADTVVSTMTGTADGAWTMTLEGRDPVALTVTVVGDSLISESAEYESVLRKGVMVSVRTASMMHDGMLMGNMVATYKTDGVTETVLGTITGTRVQQ